MVFVVQYVGCSHCNFVGNCGAACGSGGLLVETGVVREQLTFERFNRLALCYLWLGWQEERSNC